MRRAAITAVLLSLAAPVSAHQANIGDAGIIESVVPGSPAAAAGMLAGDRLISLDGRTIATQSDLQAVMGAHAPGDRVPLLVVRDGEPVDLTLTFGARPDGGVSIGIRINLHMEQDADGEGERGTTECLAWIDRTYRIDAVLKSLELDLAETYRTAQACVARDTRRMTSDNAIKNCDNVFKVHCSGVDLLTEIGEAQVNRCAAWLEDSLGMQVRQLRGWTTCAEQKVFERSSTGGEAGDKGACRAALLDECGVNIDAAIRAGELSPEQREFAACCRADRLGPDGGAAAGRCPMIDDGFARGPCRDHPVCINRLNSEWFHCPGPE